MSELQPMETAPKDGTPVRLFGKYLPDCGMVHIWQFHPGTGGTGWTTARGLACFEWSGWTPVPEDVAFAIAAEREACATMLDNAAAEARIARDNYRVLHETTHADRHDNRASAYAAGANAIRARGAT